jgi:hypothetical protein
MPLIQRAAIGVLVFLLLLLAGLRTAHAVEIIPSIGVSKMSDADEQKMFVAVGLRQSLLPRISTELNVGYRKEAEQGAFEMSTIPVTVSLWASPVPMLYAGAGAGAYFQAFRYDDSLLIPDESKTQFGAHVGGGFRMPIAPIAKIDLHARYVFLQEESTSLSTAKFDPSFWTASAGLAIGF